MKNNQTPEIRFRGFTEYWEQQKLGDLAHFSKGNGYSKSDLTDEGEPIILYGRLYTKYETVIESVDTFTIEKEKSVVSKGNEVIVPSSGETSEDISRASVVKEPGIILGGDLNIIRPTNDIDSVFLALSISNGKQRKELIKRAQGKSIVHLHNSDLKEVNFSSPKKEEQTKIANFFKQLDATIVLQEQELAILKQTKQEFLKNMFPKDGESIPAFRFPEFTGDWDECKLGELMEVTSVKRIHQSDWTAEGVRFLRARDIVANFKKQKVSEYLYISVDRYEEYSTKSGKVSPGDLLVTGVGSIGVPMLVTNDEPIYFKDGNIIWFKNDQRINGEFFYYSFENGKTQKYIRDVAGIGTVGTYTIDSGKKTPISLPVFEEQIKIGNLFKQLDEIIAIHQQELEALQKTKEAFLQKMFV